MIYNGFWLAMLDISLQYLLLILSTLKVKKCAHTHEWPDQNGEVY